MDYSTLLTNEQKKSILDQRIAQFATEAYQHLMNLRVAKSLENDEGVENAQKALATLEYAIVEHQAELKSLK